MEGNKDNKVEVPAFDKHNTLIDSVLLSRTDSKTLFFHKKTERIAGALYMMTNFFATNEPLKWTIREEAIGLIKDIASLAQSSLSAQETIIRSVTGRVCTLSSLLHTAHIAGFISNMNAEVLHKELNQLLHKIEEKDSGRHSVRALSFAADFFEVKEKEEVHKGHIKDIEKKEEKTVSFIKPITPQKKEISQVNVSFNSRTDLIIKALEKGGFMSIKDFTKVVKNCSEKTIQRELTSLVLKGVVKKTGERRWSTYSLSK
jgi:hypothetical protein